MEKQIYLVKSENGWTFMETLIVIAIVLILTSSVGYMAIQYIPRARIAATKSQIESFCVALESYYIDCGRYPAVEQGLEALWQKPTIQPVNDRWAGPYILKSVPQDPWGNPYEYTIPGKNGLPYGIRSFGADGREGGEKNDADITSWSE
jgi:general secretion pathway protein G